MNGISMRYRPSEGDHLWYDASAQRNTENRLLNTFTPRIIGGITLSLRGVIRDAIQTRRPSYRMSTQQNPMSNLFRIVRDAKLMSKSITKELQFTSPSEVPDALDLDAFARRLLLDRNSGIDLHTLVGERSLRRHLRLCCLSTRVANK